VSWYTKKLDFRLRQVVPLGGLTFATQSPPGDDRFIFELLAGPGATSLPAYLDIHDSCKLAGWHHLCFRVDSVDGAVDQLRHRDVTIIAEPRDIDAVGLRVAF